MNGIVTCMVSALCVDELIDISHLKRPAGYWSGIYMVAESSSK
ncbi:hypothetical protein A2U01_0112060, partial [Trifolium medium]|nr:hypothetical protein [Trifolium medium]